MELKLQNTDKLSFVNLSAVHIINKLHLISHLQ